MFSRAKKNSLDSDKSTRPPIVKEDLDLPGPFKGKLAFLLHNVLTEEECKNFIKESEKKGYEVALINTGDSETLMTDVRKSSRCMIDSFDYTFEIWSRIKEFVPEIFKQKRVIGLNERLRFLRYDPGDYFKPHFDGAYRRDNGECSLVTFQLYLNEGFKGGATTFLTRANGELPVIPKTGSVLIFEHHILHEGSTLIEGRKYAVRTDVMYTRDNVE